MLLIYQVGYASHKYRTLSETCAVFAGRKLLLSWRREECDRRPDVVIHMVQLLAPPHIQVCEWLDARCAIYAKPQRGVMLSTLQPTLCPTVPPMSAADGGASGSMCWHITQTHLAQCAWLRKGRR